MHTDHGVLKALSGQYSPEQLASVLNRVLRVPEAWAALHNPGFLAEVGASPPFPQLTPSHLAALALGGDLTKPIQTELAEPHLERGRRGPRNVRRADASKALTLQNDSLDRRPGPNG